MAVTMTIKTQHGKASVPGAEYLSYGTIAFDSSYPTGGEAVSAVDLGFPSGTTVHAVIFDNAGGYSFAYDHANAKVKAFWVDTTTDGAALAEVADTTSLATVTARFIAVGLASA
jgi:hypothetical protein